MENEINILVVEDDNDINTLLCNIIRNSGYRPQPAFSGTEAMLYLEKRSWDMVLLDLMLPGMSGEELLEKISEQLPVPVMIISAKSEQQTKIEALRTGADDYITKPFDIEEVSARIDSHLRRYRRMNQTLHIKELTYKDIRINTESQTVVVNEKEILFTAREYAILTLLLSSPKKVFTKANLFESVWNEKYYGDDNTISVHMSNLRSKLSKANPHEDYIETVWGVGYKLKT
ncbi:MULTISPECIES: response regulator transcription factor [unclassified Cytobacillus]|uniref:response regulator transcription factor n=1 Tax=unclassified Cytobacillus TaxID=2675268 RepID=UPI00135676DB|nr:response regulator transcription factor [Cytobacillus sp. AMY 15.2]KAF0818169.1 Two-component transcriptional response regulator, OmpR family [Bacillus sp. ZZV12-4809]MCM3093588.1 response regulator transcription factor [Cytobacillus sp. AMY 15.2]